MKFVTTILLIGLFGCNKNSNSNQEKLPDQEKPEEVISTVKPPTWDNVVTQKIETLGYHPQFTLDGKSIIYTSQNYDGLWIYNLEENSNKQLTDKKGAGYKPEILQNKIIYRVKTRLKYLEEVDIVSGKIVEVEKEYSRLTPSDYAWELQNLDSKDKKTVRLSEDLLSIEVQNEDGTINKMAPKGKGNYLSTSLSPDQLFILFKIAGLGGYISDINGTVIKELGDVNDPSWLGNNEILYAKSEDDGMQTLSSEVFIYDLKKEQEYQLTNHIENQLENPKGNVAGDALVMNSPDGVIYLLKKR